jgi:putative ABC transport system permease protein
MIFWSMAWRNLILHRRRSMITGTAIAFGFCGVVLLGGYMMRMENYLKTHGIYLSHVGHIAIYKKDGLEKYLTDPELYNLSLEDQQNIERTAREMKHPPEMIARYLRGQGLITNGCRSYPFFMTATEPQAEVWTRTHPLTRYWTPELLVLKRGHGYWEPAVTQDSIVVAYRLARLLQKPFVVGDAGENATTADSIITNCDDPAAWEKIRQNASVQLIGNGFNGGIAAADARVSAQYSTGLALTDDSSILVPLKFGQDFFGTDRVTWMSLYLKDAGSTSHFASQLRKVFAKNGWKYDVYTYRDESVNPFYIGAMNFVYVMMIFFVVLVCGVVALSILNSLQISLLERKVELGTLRAVGFKQRAVTSLFVREVFLLAIVSVVVGGTLAYVISGIINSLNLRFSIVGNADNIQFLLKPTMWLTFATGSLFVAVASLTCFLECMRRLRSKIVNLLEQA